MSYDNVSRTLTSIIFYVFDFVPLVSLTHRNFRVEYDAPMDLQPRKCCVLNVPSTCDLHGTEVELSFVKSAHSSADVSSTSLQKMSTGLVPASQWAQRSRSVTAYGDSGRWDISGARPRGETKSTKRSVGRNLFCSVRVRSTIRPLREHLSLLR